MKKLFWMPAAAMAIFLVPEIAQAHFTLVEPASWLEHDCFRLKHIRR
jgi:hypothetical protein